MTTSRSIESGEHERPFSAVRSMNIACLFAVAALVCINLGRILLALVAGPDRIVDLPWDFEEIARDLFRTYAVGGALATIIFGLFAAPLFSGATLGSGALYGASIAGLATLLGPGVDYAADRVLTLVLSSEIVAPLPAHLQAMLSLPQSPYQALMLGGLGLAGAFWLTLPIGAATGALLVAVPRSRGQSGLGTPTTIRKSSSAFD